MAKQASDYKGMVILAAFLAPLLGGAIIYYSLKSSHETMAKLGNNMSWVACVIWILAAVGLRQAGIAVPQFVSLLIGVAGIVLAVVTVVGIKKT